MTARVCQYPGCDRPAARRWCGEKHRRAAAAARRAARRRAERAAAVEARQDALLEAVERLYYLTLAARQVGVDPSTAYAWMRADAAFAARVETARMIAADGHEGHLLAVARAAEPDPTRLRAAESVCRRIDANEARKRHATNRSDRQAAQAAPDVAEPDCAGALAWARRPKLEAV